VTPQPRVLLVNQYFWPDMAATAQLLSDLAEELVEAGWTVTALPGRGGYAPGRDGQLPRREPWRGVDIHRVWSTDLGRGSKPRRLLDYATYFLSAAKEVLFGTRHDTVVCLSTPPLVALLGLLARWRGSRFIYKVEDLYPDVAVALGALGRRSPLTALLRGLAGRILAGADAAVALDSAMAQRLSERGARRVEVIPNWADGEAIRPDPEAGKTFRRQQGLSQDHFIVLYSGNLGMAHRFDAVLAAIHALAVSHKQVTFLFVGAGPRLQEVQRATAGLATVRFLPYQPRETLGALYSAADLHLVTLRDEVSGLLVPSKYAASLAAGKPVLLVGGDGTDLHREIRQMDLGWVCSHHAPEVVTAMRQALDDRRALERKGRDGRTVFDARYSRSRSTAAWIRLLNEPFEGSP